MPRKNKNIKSALRAQARENRFARKGNEQKTWVFVVRLILIGLLVLALGGSLFLGIFASAYSLPLPEAQATRALQTAAEKEHYLILNDFEEFPLQTGDRIDGRPAESYQSVTDDLPAVEAPYAALCTRDGRILFERNIDERVTMASTTKMMTAIVALEALPLDTQLYVTYGAAKTAGTNAGLEEGMTISLLDCLYALLLPSGNDAAVVIAQNVAEMESRFVEMMNKKAAELGMTSTHFEDASGLSVCTVDEDTGAVEGHYTTVRDYMILTRYCMTNPTFRKVVSTGLYEVSVDYTTLSFKTTDMLRDFLTGPEAIGVKTGYTDEAGYCFVGAAESGGLELYTVVFNASTTDQRFIDTAELLEWGFRHYRTLELINTTQQVADVALLSWIDKTVAAYVPTVVRIEFFDLNGPITQDIIINDIEGEATKGHVCGQIVWVQGGEVLMTSEIVVDKTILPPDFWEGIGIAWKRFWGGFAGDPDHAETKILLKTELVIPPLPQLQEEA